MCCVTCVVKVFLRLQLEFFGKLAWTILLRCTIPLAIFHRFHSTVVLAAIWKNSYKSRIE